MWQKQIKKNVYYYNINIQFLKVELRNFRALMILQDSHSTDIPEESAYMQIPYYMYTELPSVLQMSKHLCCTPATKHTTVLAIIC